MNGIGKRKHEKTGAIKPVNLQNWLYLKMLHTLSKTSSINKTRKNIIHNFESKMTNHPSTN